MADAPVDPLTALEKRLGADWTHLRKAREVSAAKRQEIGKLSVGLDSEDTSIVVSGSLARDEFTDGSDIDWSLLIDGSADPKHYDLLRKIGSVIDTLAAKSPGPEGTFGKMVFSHGLIHEIGGEDDTNLNRPADYFSCLNRERWGVTSPITTSCAAFSTDICWKIGDSGEGLGTVFPGSCKTTLPDTGEP